jgi:tetratricopeptide (TPR) repeat protein
LIAAAVSFIVPNLPSKSGQRPAAQAPNLEQQGELHAQSADTKPPSTAEVSPEKQKKLPSLEWGVPAPGCPDKLPTYQSAAVLCEQLNTQPACSGGKVCGWNSQSGRCFPLLGSYLPQPENGMGPDYAEYVAAAADLKLANDYEAKGEFVKAITEYTKILADQPDMPLALTNRARMYERVNEKSSAIKDYCRILVIGSSRARRTAALERLGELTKPTQTTSTSSPVAPSQPYVRSLPDLPYATYKPVPPRQLDLSPIPPAVAAPPIEVLENRPTAVLKHIRRRGSAPFKVITEAGANYLIKLINTADPTDWLEVYIKSGDDYSTTVPVGTYYVHAASGYNWQGSKDHFGKDTKYIEFQDSKGETSGKPTVIRFSQNTQRVGRRIMTSTQGHTLSIKAAIDGNITQKEIRKEDF